MPSFLTDENAPIYTQSADIVELKPSNDFAKAIDRKEPRPVSRATNESVSDGVSARSSQTSHDPDNRDQMNGAGTRPTSMSSFTNGISRGGQSGSNASDVETVSKPAQNGDDAADASPGSSALPAISGGPSLAVPPLTNGTGEADLADAAKPPSPQASTQKRASVSSSGGPGPGSVQQSPVDLYPKQNRLGDGPSSESGPVPTLATIPSSSVPASFAPSPSLAPETQTPTPTPDATKQSSHPPHRFSSPPVYHHSAGPSGASTYGPQQPPQSGLRHRHTLEVPKVAPGRGSRDGADGSTAAHATGRFSPTAGGGGPSGGGGGGRRTSLSLARRNTRSIHSDLAPREEIIPDEDVLRWTEAYRQKRASKRRKREIEDDDRVLVGTKVDESHANWVTAYNMLTGIRVSVSRTNAKLDRPLTMADFEAKQKSTFDIAGNELVPSAKYDFKFKDYAPWVFRHLRALFRLDPADYLMSLTGKYILSELGSPGKSGSFFYFSRDYKYIIKTIHHSEHKFLRKILKDYYDHVTENPNTLLSQFYGLHRVKMPYGKKIHFVVMNNLFPPHRDIHQTFDLKGSTVGRYFKEEDIEKNPRATLKDINWMRRHRHLELGMIKKRLFLDQLHRDVQLLQRLQIMDYSLLIGIHDLQRGNEENLRQKTLQVFNPGGNKAPEEYDPHSVLMRTPSKLESARKARELRQMLQAERPVPMGESSSEMPDELDEGLQRPGFIFNSDDGGFRATHENNTPADEVYYLGVIDCLTHYGIVKKIEHFWKSLSHDASQISALPPQEYGERFFNFVSSVTMSHEEAERQREAEEAAAAAAAASAEQEKERVSSWNSSLRRKSASVITPIACCKPPSPTTGSSGKAPEHEGISHKAEKQAEKAASHGVLPESEVPTRILATTKIKSSSAPAIPGAGAASSSSSGAILPVVVEAPGEASSTGDGEAGSAEVDEGRSSRRTDEDAGPSQINQHHKGPHGDDRPGSEAGDSSDDSSDDDDNRPLTPVKDGSESAAGFGNPVFLSSPGRRQQRERQRRARAESSGTAATAATTATTVVTAASPTRLSKKPESADSGYGTAGGGGSGASSSLCAPPTPAAAGPSATASAKQKVRQSISRESLDKALPPLPISAGETMNLPHRLGKP